jgi:hypothetical protein
MKFAAALACFIALSSCRGHSRGQDEEKRYSIVSQSGTADQLCDEAQRVQAAYLQDGDQPNYERWRGNAKRDCAMARLHDYSALPD